MFLLDVTCALGNGSTITMDAMIPKLITMGITIIKIAVPILLIIFGMLDLGKAVIAQKEDEIKKGQQTFIKRLIAAAVVFLVVFIVQLVFNLVSDEDGKTLWNCVDCMINYSTENKSCGY